jgi:hypothetical protein
MTASNGPSLCGEFSLKAFDNPIFEHQRPYSPPTLASLPDAPSQALHQATRPPLGCHGLSPCSNRASRWKVLEGNLPKMTPPHKHVAADARNHLRAFRMDMDEMHNHCRWSHLSYAASDQSIMKCPASLPAKSSSRLFKYSPANSDVSSLVHASVLASSDHRSLHSLQEQVHAIMRWQYDMAREIRMFRVW